MVEKVGPGGGGYTSLCGDEVLVWLDPCGIIMLKTKTSHGDPVELNEEEARALVVKLTEFIEAMR